MWCCVKRCTTQWLALYISGCRGYRRPPATYQHPVPHQWHTCATLELSTIGHQLRNSTQRTLSGGDKCWHHVSLWVCELSSPYPKVSVDKLGTGMCSGHQRSCVGREHALLCEYPIEKPLHTWVCIYSKSHTRELELVMGSWTERQRKNTSPSAMSQSMSKSAQWHVAWETQCYVYMCVRVHCNLQE